MINEDKFGLTRFLGMALVILMMCLIMASGVEALGISPGRTTIGFEPGLQRSVSFSVINSESKSIDVVIAVQGELKDYVNVGTTSFSMTPGEGSRQVSYELNLPSTMEPGVHTAEVVVLQLPNDVGTSEAFVGAALAVVTQVHIYVPYPGKYANAELMIINADKEGEVKFVIPVVSAGEFDLVSVKANIDVYNKLNEKVDSFNTQEISVASGTKKDIVHSWNAGVPVGDYRAVATLIYDGETKMLEGEFSVGNQELDLQQIEVNDFSLGDIAKMEMLVENKWSENIQGAYAQTNIYNDRGELMADFRSAEYEIPALSKRVMTSYWDTAGVKKGTYDTKVFLKYAGQSVETGLQLKVKENSIEIIGLGYVISSDSSGSSGGGNGLIILLGIGILVLILINLLWFFLLRKKLKS
jgi:hypothetical protein